MQLTCYFRTGEAPRAYIVKQDGTDLTETEIHSFMEKNVAAYKQLTGGIEFVDEIPKSAAGKILRKDLRAKYESKQQK